MSGSREMTLKDGDQLCNPSAFVLCRQVPGGFNVRAPKLPTLHMSSSVPSWSSHQAARASSALRK